MRDLFAVALQMQGQEDVNFYSWESGGKMRAEGWKELKMP